MEEEIIGKNIAVKTGKAGILHRFAPPVTEDREALWALEAYAKPFAALLEKHAIAPKFGFYAEKRKRLCNYARFIALGEQEIEFRPLDIFGQMIPEEELSRFITPNLFKECEDIRNSARENGLRGGDAQNRKPDIRGFSIRQGFKNAALIEIESAGGAFRQAVRRWIGFIRGCQFSEVNLVKVARDESGVDRRNIIFGDNFIVEKIAGLSVRISAGNNPHQNGFAVEQAAAWVASFAPADPDAVALAVGDGAGAYAMAAASNYSKVAALPISEISANDIEHNAKYNGFNNIRLFESRAAALKQFPLFDILVISENLPLKNKELNSELLQVKPRKIISFSLRPQEQIEFIEQAANAGYSIKKFYIFEYVPIEKRAIIGALLERANQ